MLVSEGHPMKVHNNQWFLNALPAPHIPWGAQIKAYPMVPEVQMPSQGHGMGQPSAI